MKSTPDLLSVMQPPSVVNVEGVKSRLRGKHASASRVKPLNQRIYSRYEVVTSIWKQSVAEKAIKRRKIRRNLFEEQQRNAELQKKLAIRPLVHPWNDVAKIGCSPDQNCVSIKPTDRVVSRKVRKPVMGYNSRVLSQYSLRKQREEFFELACAIAERYQQLEEEKKYARFEKRYLAQMKVESNSLRNHIQRERRPKRVDDFENSCEHQQGMYRLPNVVLPHFYEQREAKTTVDPRFKVRTGKMPKTRSVWYEHNQNCVEYPQPKKIAGKEERLACFRRNLCRTPLGIALSEGFDRVLLSRLSELDLWRLQNYWVQPQSAADDCEDRRVCGITSGDTSLKSDSGVEAQMDTEGVQIDKKSNVALVTTAEVDTATISSTISGFKDLSISREKQHFETMGNRWMQIATVDWTLRDIAGAKIWSIDILRGILNNQKESQNAQLFFTHRLVRCDVRIRLVVNGNRFLVGQAIADGIYCGNEDNISLIDHMPSAFQRQHVTLLANASNDAELVIPYRNIDSMICGTDKSIFAKVAIRVVNPLLALQNMTSKVNITVFATFENFEFAGMIARNIGVLTVEEPEDFDDVEGEAEEVVIRFADAQMDTVTNLMNAGSELIRTVRGDPNRDNPPRPLQPLSLVPQSMTSMAYTDFVSAPLNTLRADPRGQTPHADFKDEMDPYEIMKKPGYLTTIEWSSRLTHGSRLASFPVSPLMIDSYPTVSLPNRSLKGQILPPIAYISNFFSKFRGNINFRIQVVASCYHTGTLLVSSVPMVSGNISFRDLKFSAYQTFDIVQNAEFVYEVPWQWKNSFASVRDNSVSYDKPSHLYIYILNPLGRIEQVVDKVYINVFVSAGESFEVAIPRPPLCDPYLADPLVIPSTEYLHPYQAGSAIYSTWNRLIKSLNGKYPVVPYYSNITDGFWGFTNAKKGEVYKLGTELPENSKYKYRILVSKKAGAAWDKDIASFTSIQYAVYHPALSTANEHGLIACKTGSAGSESSFALAMAKAILDDTDVAKALDDNALMWVEDGPWAQVMTGPNAQGVETWIPATSSQQAPFWTISKIQPNMDPAPTISLERSTASSDRGLSTFGERTPDLKSICRRFEHCGSLNLKTCTIGNPRDCPYSARVKVYPLRQLLPSNSASFDNRWRHGTITTVGLIYRGWRGGMRYKFSVVGSPPEGTIIYATHRHDSIMSKSDPFIQEGPSKVLTRDDMLNTQYATYAQDLSVNGNFEIEVPYYSEKEFLSCLPGSPPTDAYNGSLYFWVHSKVSSDIHLEVFYSIADDFRFSVFQGCPVTLDITQIQAEPNIGFLSPQDREDIRLALGSSSQGLLDPLRSVSSAVFGSVSQAPLTASDGSTTTLGNLANRMSKVVESISGITETVKEKLSPTAIWESAVKNKGTLYRIFSEVIHMVIARSYAAYAWSIFNILIEIFPKFEITQRWVTSFTSFLKRKDPTERTQGVVPNSGEEDSVSEVATLLFSSLALYCGVKITDFSSIKGLGFGLFQTSHIFKSVSYISSTIADLFRLLKRCVIKLISYFGTYSPNLPIFSGDGNTALAKWLSDTAYITSPAVEESITESTEKMNKVFELGIMGRYFLVAALNEKAVPAQMVNQIKAYQTRLENIETKLVSAKSYMGTRLEPVCVWVGGASGTGKTQFIHDYSKRLSNTYDYKHSSAAYARTPGNKFFDAYTGQPCIILDDFLSLSSTQDPESYNQFLHMKSATLFNPPYSKTEDKNRLVNFPFLLVSSNQCFFTDEAGINCLDAFNRRRDIVVEFTHRDVQRTYTHPISGVKVTQKPDPSDIKHAYTADELYNLEHVDVKIHMSNASPQSFLILKRRQGSTLREVLHETLDKSVRNNYEHYAKNYVKSATEFRSALTRSYENDKTLEDQLTEFFDKYMKVKSTDVSDMATPVKWFLSYFRSQSGDEDAALSVAMPPSVTPSRPGSSGEVVHVRPVEPPNTVAQLNQLNRTMDTVSEVLSGQELPPTEDLFSDASERVEAQMANDPFLTLTNVVHNVGESSRSYLPESIKTLAREAPNTWVKEGCLIPTFDISQICVTGFSYDLMKKENLYKPKCAHREMVGTTRKYNIVDGNVIWEDYYLLSSSAAFSRVFAPLSQCYVCVNGRPEPSSGCVLNTTEEFKVWANKILVQGFNLAEDRKAFYDFAKRTCSSFVSAITETELKAPNPHVLSPVRLLKKFQIIIRNTVRCYLGFCICITRPLFLLALNVWETMTESLFLAIKVIVSVSTCVAFFIASAHFYRYITASDVEPNIHPSGDYTQIKKPNRLKRALTLIQPQDGTEDRSLSDAFFKDRNRTQAEAIIDKINRNVLFLVASIDGKDVIARCIGLQNKKFLVLKHYIEHFFNSGVTSVAVVYRHGKHVEKEVLLKDIEFSWTEEGYGVGILPHRISRQFINIIPLIPSSKFDGCVPAECFVVEPGYGDNKIHVLTVKNIKTPISVNSSSTASAWVISEGYEYQWAGKGKCGSYLIAPNLATPLIGIHTAGFSTEIGYSEMLLRETFEDEAEPVIEYIEPQMDSSEGAYKLDGDYTPVGRLDSDLVPSFSLKTRICPSEIHGVFDVKTEPAPLHKSDPRLETPSDIFKIGVSKRCKPLKEFPKHIVSLAMKDFSEKVDMFVKPLRSDMSPLSVTQAIEGLPIAGYEPMEMSTSEGYPWVLMRPSFSSNKSWLFDLDFDSAGKFKVKGLQKNLKLVLDEKMNNRKNGIVPLTYFTACLKDSRILKSKVSIPGKTRIFEMSPVDLTIAQRQYFLDFYASYRKCREMEHTIGINPDGEEWTRLADELVYFSPHILTADYSGYGPSVNHTILNGVIDIQINWLNQHAGNSNESVNVRHSLKHEIMHGLHIARNLVFIPSSGLPSGNAATVELNSMVNSVYIRIAYLDLARQHAPHYADFFWFNRLVCLRHNGDDLIMAVKSQIVKWFNNETLISYFSNFGLKMTDSAKSGIVVPFCTIEEATYLKRGFLKHPSRANQWLAPLESSSVTDTANWVWRSVDWRGASFVNSEMSSRLSYSSGPDFYVYVSNTLKSAWKRKGVLFEYPSWSSLDHHVWEGTEGPKYSFQ